MKSPCRDETKVRQGDEISSFTIVTQGEDDTFGDVTFYNSVSETTQPIVPVNHVFEINAIKYTKNGRKVPEITIDPILQSGLLPHIMVNVFMSLNCKCTVYALWDTGCTSSLISESFYQRFPEKLKKDIDHLDEPLGVATEHDSAKIIGKINLMLAFKAFPNDRYPLVIQHPFYIGTRLIRDMYLGHELVSNSALISCTVPDGVHFILPDPYPFPRDPNDPDGLKIVPFILLTQADSLIVNPNALTFQPHEDINIICKLNRPLVGHKVKIKNNTSYFPFTSDPLTNDNMPFVTETETKVDANNEVSITLKNMDHNILHLDANTALAIVSPSKPHEQGFTIFEVNEVFDTAQFYTSPQLPKELMSLMPKEEIYNLNGEINETRPLTDTDLEEGFTKYLETEPIIPQKSKKSDFTEQEFLEMFDFSQISSETATAYKKIFLKHRNAFSHFPLDIRECKTYTHDITVVGQPSLPKQRLIQDKVLPQVAKAVEDLISANVMQRGFQSEHYSNFVPVLKKDGKTVRLCCDLIELNKNIVSSNKIVQMGSPDQLLRRIFHKRHLLSLDISSAYYHIPVSDNCKKYYGMYSYKRGIQDPLRFIRVIQGEKTAVFAYNDMTHKTYGDFFEWLAFWIDDGLIFVDGEMQLISCTEKFVERTDVAGLSISPSKINFNQTEIPYLGKQINIKKGCYQVPEAKIQGLLKLKPCINYKTLRSFLGILKYYNAHFPGIGIAAQPLQNMLRGQTSKTFVWDDTAQNSFLACKAAIAESMILHFPYENGIYQIFTDASMYTYSMHLYSRPRPPQVGEPKLIAMFSSSFKGPSLNWNMYYKELWAVVYAVGKWIEYLYGQEIEIFTDCKSLLYCSTAKAAHVVTYRLALQLSGLNISFFHVTGKLNRADYSSRTWQAFLDKGTKIKAKSPNEIAAEVDKMPVKDYYSPEEVQILLTHNFSTPITEQRLIACKDKYRSILSKLNFDKPKIKAHCCPDHHIEISNLQHAQTTSYFTEKTHSLAINHTCSSFQENTSSSYASSSARCQNNLTQYDINGRKGRRIFDYFNQINETEILHFNEKYGYSFIPFSENNNQGIANVNHHGHFVNQLCAVNNFTQGKKAFFHLQNANLSLPPEISIDLILSNIDLFTKEIPHIKIFPELENADIFFHCNSECHIEDPVATTCNSVFQRHNINRKLIQSIIKDNNRPTSWSKSQILKINAVTRQQRKLRNKSPSPERKISDSMEDLTDQDKVDAEIRISYYDKLKAQVFKYGILTIPEFIKAQEDDNDIEKIKAKFHSSSAKVREDVNRNYFLHKGILFKRNSTNLDKLQKNLGIKLYIPDILVPFILDREHINPTRIHIPSEVMANSIKQKYYFPNIDSLCSNYVNQCRICSFINKDTRPKHHFGKTLAPERPLQSISIDYGVNLPPSKEGYRHLILIMDNHSRYSMALPVKTRSSKELLKVFMNSWVAAFQFPEFIVCDRELSFISGEFYNYMTSMGVEFNPNIAYRPQAGAKIESNMYRAKRALTSFMLAMANRGDWPIYLPLVMMGLNNQIHSSLDISAFHALFCFQKADQILDILRMTLEEPDEQDPDKYLLQRIDRDLLDSYIISHNNSKVQKNQKYLNKHTIYRSFKKGQKVMRRVQYHMLGPMVNRSLKGKFIGPYCILRVFEHTLLMLDEALMPTPKSKEKLVDLKKQFVKDHKNHCKIVTPENRDLMLPISAMDDLHSLLNDKNVQNSANKNNTT